ncbi:Uncharacterised protein [Klebsiella oxytoca]|nr:Uncharacterised protein [Klebsiella oxytoca]
MTVAFDIFLDNGKTYEKNYFFDFICIHNN